MNKVIFLDIDGVLNSGSWNESHQWEIRDSGNRIAALTKIKTFHKFGSVFRIYSK